MRTPFQEKRERDEAPLRAQIAEGFRFMWNQPFLRSCALLFTFTNLVFEGMFLTLIVVGRRQGLSGGEIGALIAIFGVCSLAGSIVAPRIVHALSMRAIVIGSFWLQLGIVAFVVKPSIWVLLSAHSCRWRCSSRASTRSSSGIASRSLPIRLTGRVNSVARTIALLRRAARAARRGSSVEHGVQPGDRRRLRAVILFALAAGASLAPSIRNAPDLDEAR